MAIILAIDNESDIRSLIADALSPLQVVTAANGEEGIAKLRSAKYNLVICDIGMPKTGGIGVLGFIKKNNIRTPLVGPCETK